MAIESDAELITAIQNLMGSSFDKVSNDGFARAIAQAKAELHWTLPLNDPQKEYWMIERSKRYVLFILLTESAHKFQYKKISLQHRFQHYIQLIKLLDEDFQNALENSPELFDVDSWGNLCFYITNGFSYDFLGNDTTYEDMY